MKGKVHSLQSMGTVDGPGVRFVVFLQGCPLRCAYCHNPDTWMLDGGTEYTAQDLLEKIQRYRPYFGTQGGVTVSGGEALLQADFVAELFALCKENGIHTTLDTSGCIWNPSVEKLLSVTDLVLLDIKMTTDVQYKEFVGCSLQQPMEFLEQLYQRRIPVWIRQVIVQGFNDTEENISMLRTLLAPYHNIQKIELLPFRKLCKEKYDEMGIPFRFDSYPETPQAVVEALSAKL